MSNVTFVPVVIKYGRKYRGFAYALDKKVYSRFGAYYEKLWNPIDCKFVYANPDYVETAEIDTSKYEADLTSYIKHVIEDTISWCATKCSNSADTEMKQFARNILLKHYPELADEINKVLPDNRDTLKEIEKTVDWAMKLTTRPMQLYGKWCKGGKPIPEQRKVNIAYNALCKRGIDKLDNFKELFMMQLDIRGLPYPKAML